MDLDLLSRLAVALAIGMLIGIERGWVTRGEAEGERTAGLRTLALAGLLGGVAAALDLKLSSRGLLLGTMFLAYAAIIATFRYREMVRDKTFGATTVIAALLTFALGAFAVAVDPSLASAAGVAMAGLMVLKPLLHGWLKSMTWEELRSGLVLLAMSLILLPVLPNRGFGPHGALNPYELWLMTVLIAAVSSAGYVAMKWVRGGQGVALSALAGGLVSSTAVTVSFAQLAKEQPDRAAVLVGGALLASATMILRILLVASAVSTDVLRWLVLPLGFAVAATIVMSAWYFWSHAGDKLDKPIELKSPFDLPTVLKFGLFLAAIVLAAKVLTVWAGTQGAYLLAAVSGIADVDAITLSMSRLAGSGIEAEAASAAILIAAAVNTVSKAVLGWAAGGREPGVRLALAALPVLAAGAVGFVLAHYIDLSAWLAAPPAAA